MTPRDKRGGGPVHLDDDKWNGGARSLSRQFVDDDELRLPPRRYEWLVGGVRCRVFGGRIGSQSTWLLRWPTTSDAGIHCHLGEMTAHSSCFSPLFIPSKISSDCPVLLNCQAPVGDLSLTLIARNHFAVPSDAERVVGRLSCHLILWQCPCWRGIRSLKSLIPTTNQCTVQPQKRCRAQT